MGYWKINHKNRAYAYKSKIIWWQLYGKARRSWRTHWSFGITWYGPWKQIQICIGTWIMNIFFLFLKKENKDS